MRSIVELIRAKLCSNNLVFDSLLCRLFTNFHVKSVATPSAECRWRGRRTRSQSDCYVKITKSRLIFIVSREAHFCLLGARLNEQNGRFRASKQLGLLHKTPSRSAKVTTRSFVVCAFFRGKQCNIRTLGGNAEQFLACGITAVTSTRWRTMVFNKTPPYREYFNSSFLRQCSRIRVVLRNSHVVFHVQRHFYFFEISRVHQ